MTLVTHRVHPKSIDNITTLRFLLVYPNVCLSMSNKRQGLLGETLLIDKHNLCIVDLDLVRREGTFFQIRRNLDLLMLLSMDDTHKVISASEQ